MYDFGSLEHLGYLGLIQSVCILCIQSENKAGNYVGIELDEPRGRMQGIVGGEQYFACKPKHGVLLLARKVELVTNVEKFNVGDLVMCGSLGEGIVKYYGPHAVSIAIPPLYFARMKMR